MVEEGRTIKEDDEIENQRLAFIIYNPQHQQQQQQQGLRSLQWRINLGVLPSPSSCSCSCYVDDLRRVTAESRRTYARLRRRLLIDPHIHKDAHNSPDPVVENPLSQDPDSNWSRFFRNAELEKTVYQDLSRLYPEHGNYFQNTGRQGMLRRILLLWCLTHPDYGYRQGMHELLAPLLYVLNVDVEHLSEVRKTYDDHFTDTFDAISYLGSNDSYNLQVRRFSESAPDKSGSLKNAQKVGSLDELDPRIQTIILLSDTYGVEGELGVVLSEKFMEHDAYCMFDALMGGFGGAVAMADFFYSPVAGPLTNLPPVIEASAALFHLLSIVDSSIHSHLIELGVEPQYFALRWLRVLFGREFSLENLLVIWDNIFASDNTKLDSSVADDEVGFKLLNSRRGAFIAAVAVSMILYMRSSILATETATSALQRLLKFPENVNLDKLIEKAMRLQVIALDSNIKSSNTYSNRGCSRSESLPVRGHSHSDFSSPRTPISVVPESYWEERWRDLQKAEENKQGTSEKRASSRSRRGWADKIRQTLSRTESDPSHAKLDSNKKDEKPFVRRRLLEDLSHVLGSEDGEEITLHEDAREQNNVDGRLPTVMGVKKQEGFDKDFSCAAEESCSSGNDGSEESLSIFSDPISPPSEANDHENGSEKSSVGSDAHPDESEDRIQDDIEEPMLPISSHPKDLIVEPTCNEVYKEKLATVSKERKLLSDIYQWIGGFRRNAAGEGTSSKGGCASEAAKPPNNENSVHSASSSLAAAASSNSSNGGTGVPDQNVYTVNNLGQSMLQHIQVIESAIQKDHGQKSDSLDNISENVIIGKGDSTALAALKELRKISSILSEL